LVREILEHYRIVWCEPYFGIMKRLGVNYECGRQTDRQAQLQCNVGCEVYGDTSRKKSVTGAPYSIELQSVTQLDTMVKSTMTETVLSSHHGGTAAAMAQNAQMTEEHSTLGQQTPGMLDHPAWCVANNK